MQQFKRFFLFFIPTVLFTCFISPLFALTFVLPPKGNNIVGRVQWTQALPGDTFSKIGRRFDMGYFELVEANPGLNPESIKSGTIIVIPSRFILPTVPRRGIVINLAELRVYYYPPHRNLVITYPVGIGREGWDTPLGESWIAQKLINPTWIVPESIRRDRLKDSVFLPKKVAPGPDNPLGGYALRLKQSTFLIHGTNDSEGVGRRSSAGCIRMFPEDIESLFPQVKTREPVNIIDLPYKLGWDNDKLYLEVHVPLQKEKPIQVRALEIKNLVQNELDKKMKVQWFEVTRIALAQNGIPQRIKYYLDS